MIDALWLKFNLESEACFSRGDGVPGVVDIEVQHDAYGLPFLGGRTLKGLLHAEANEIVAALALANTPKGAHWAKVATRLFGRRGSGLKNAGILHIGHAKMPADLRQQIRYLHKDANISPPEMLETLTTIRRQTAVDYATGAPKAHTFRAMRVILPHTPFVAHLTFKQTSTATARTDEIAFLLACTKAFRRAGSQKTRGYGRLTAHLHPAETSDEPLDDHTYFTPFKESL